MSMAMDARVDAMSGVYTDLNGLASLKGLGKTDRGRALDEVAQQFESLLMNMMLSSMRSANEVFAQDNPLHSNESRFYREMFDQQLAVSLSQGGGLGLADVIRRQLGAPGADESGLQQVGSSGERLKESGLSEPLTATPHAQAPAQHVRASAEHVTESRATNSAPMVPGDWRVPPQEFARELQPLAEATAARLGVPADVLLSQAALETGWGEHMLRDGAGRPSFNFFNIKAGSDWNGPVVTTPSLEYRDGVAVREWSAFRAYDTAAEAFDDYAALVQQSPRYANALAQGGDPEAYVKELAAAGYATDPDYAEKVLSVMHSERLRGGAGQEK